MPDALIPAVRDGAPEAGVVVYSGVGAARTSALLEAHDGVVHVLKTSPAGSLVAAVRAAAVS